MTSKTINLFYSYSHEDEALRDELEKHLKLLQRQHIIDTWHDRKIMSGTEWDKVINKNLNTADIILLLISADFLASDYCWDIEIQRAMQRHEKKSAVVIPVLLRPCDTGNADFMKLQGLPTLNLSQHGQTRTKRLPILLKEFVLLPRKSVMPNLSLRPRFLLLNRSPRKS
jgi:hypothetical protein